MEQKNQSINKSVEQATLALHLQDFRDQGCSWEEIKSKVSGLLVAHEIKKFRGNQSRASISLGISRGTFIKILDRVEEENGYSRKATSNFNNAGEK